MLCRFWLLWITFISFDVKCEWECTLFHPSDKDFGVDEADRDFLGLAWRQLGYNNKQVHYSDTTHTHHLTIDNKKIVQLHERIWEIENGGDGKDHSVQK